LKTLQKVRYVDPYYTWSNQQGSTRVCSKIDQTLMNGEVHMSFPEIFYEVHPEDIYDHSLLLLHLAKTLDNPKKHLQFFNM